MCGIFGYIALNKTERFQYDVKKTIEDLTIINQLRGTDGTGGFTVYKDKVTVEKTELNGSAVVTFNLLKNILNHNNDPYIMTIHNRKATKGKIAKEFSHPFQSKHITLVHNGTLHSHKWIANVEVDSEAITIGMSEAKDPINFIESLDGAYALVWYDNKTKAISFARNKDRPLWMLRTKTHLWYASEADFLQLALRRNKIEFDVKNIQELPVGVIYEFKYNKNEIIFVTKKPFTPYKTNSFFNISNFSSEQATKPSKTTQIHSNYNVYSCGNDLFVTPIAVTFIHNKPYVECQITNTTDLAYIEFITSEEAFKWAKKSKLKTTIKQIWGGSTQKIICRDPSEITYTNAPKTKNGMLISNKLLNELQMGSKCCICSVSIDKTDLPFCEVTSKLHDNVHYGYEIYCPTCTDLEYNSARFY